MDSNDDCDVITAVDYVLVPLLLISWASWTTIFAIRVAGSSVVVVVESPDYEKKKKNSVRRPHLCKRDPRSSTLTGGGTASLQVGPMHWRLTIAASGATTGAAYAMAINKSQKRLLAYSFGKRNALEKSAKSAKKKVVKAMQRIFCRRDCVCEGGWYGSELEKRGRGLKDCVQCCLFDAEWLDYSGHRGPYIHPDVARAATGTGRPWWSYHPQRSNVT